MNDLVNAYADESGDSGYRFDASSSKHFVFGIVIPHQPQLLIQNLSALRQKIRKPMDYEFHYRQMDKKERAEFFAVLEQSDMHMFIAMIDKMKAPSEFCRQGKQGLYNHAVTGLCLRASMTFNKCRLHIDGDGKQKKFLTSLKTCVRSACREIDKPNQCFKDIRVTDSSDSLIQCADIVTGAAAEHFGTSASSWMNRFQHRADVWWEEDFS